MAEVNQIKCPHCGQPYAVRPEQWAQYHGRTINCTKCGQPFVVTAPPEAAGQQPAIPPQPPIIPPQHPAAYPPPPGYPPPPYGAHPWQTTAAPPTSTSGWAIASLVTGILSFCLPVIGSIPAIVTGIVGLNKTRQPQTGGKGLAITGIVLGGLSLVFVPLMVAILLPALNGAREAANRVKCAANMQQLGQAMMSYANANGDQFPNKLEDVLQFDPSLPRTVFVCPDDDKSPPSSASVQTATREISTGQNCSYIYVGNGLNTAARPDTVLLYEPLSNHHGKGMTVLFADGHVEWLTPTEAKPILRPQSAGKRPIQVHPLSSGTSP